MKTITVTDLTRFDNRAIVCMAGLDANGNCVRPMLRGQDRGYPRFEDVRRMDVRPGSILRGDFVPSPNAVAPHVEDHSFTSFDVIGAASSEDFEALMEKSACDTFAEGFGRNTIGKVYSAGGDPPDCSIITLRISDSAANLRILVDNYDKLRVHVTDASGHRLSYLSVTDLGFSDHLAALLKVDPDLRLLNTHLRNQEKLFLRVGMSRKHLHQASGRDGYWVQINGIYTFPDYRTDLRRYD